MTSFSISDATDSILFVAIGEQSKTVCELVTAQSNQTIKTIALIPHENIVESQFKQQLDELFTLIEENSFTLFHADLGNELAIEWALILAKMIHDLRLNGLAFVSTPLKKEKSLYKKSKEALKNLREFEIGIVHYPYNNRFSKSKKNRTLEEILEKGQSEQVDSVIGIIELITAPGVINLDWVDIRTILSNEVFGYHASVQLSLPEVENSEKWSSDLKDAEKTIRKKINRLGLKWDSCERLLINISCPVTLGLRQMNEIISTISKKTDPETEIIFGTTFNTDQTTISLHVYAV